MPTKTVLCIKIAQRRINTGGMEYFPFDRVYLCDNESLSLMKKVYRYLLFTKATPELLKGLNELKITKTTSVGKHRRQEVGAQFNLANASKKFTHMCMPTYVRAVRSAKEYHIGSNGWKLGKAKGSRLMYKKSRALNYLKNEHFPCVPLNLKTPNGDISILCGACTGVLDMHEGICTSGTPSCSNKETVGCSYDSAHTSNARLKVEKQGE